MKNLILKEIKVLGKIIYIEIFRTHTWNMLVSYIPKSLSVFFVSPRKNNHYVVKAYFYVSIFWITIKSFTKEKHFFPLLLSNFGNICGPYIFFVWMTEMILYNRSIHWDVSGKKKINWVNYKTRRSLSLNSNNIFDSPRYLIHCMTFLI